MHLRFLFLLGVLGALAGSSSADVKRFAAEEFERYAQRMSGQAAPAQRITFEIAAASDGEAFSITPDGDGGDGVRVTGSDPFMLLAGTYHLLDHLGCRFLECWVMA